MTQKQIYQLDEGGVWDGLEKFARPDPMNDGGFLIPARCVEIPPPDLEANLAAQFVGGGWMVVSDFRGLTYWLPDRSIVTIDEVGIEPPADALDADPGPSIDDTKRARIIEIKRALSDIGSQKIDAITVAVLTGDKTQLQALETQAQALRSELSTI